MIQSDKVIHVINLMFAYQSNDYYQFCLTCAKFCCFVILDVLFNIT